LIVLPRVFGVLLSLRMEVFVKGILVALPNLSASRASISTLAVHDPQSIEVI